MPLETPRLVDLPAETLWERVFTVAPLVLIGSKERSGEYNQAPKHMAMPLGWDSFFCFVCTPRHGTYHNIREHNAFTVSFPRPDQVLLATLAAAPRCPDDSKPSLAALPTFPAAKIDGALVEGCYLYLECRRHSIVDGFGPNSLIVGEIVHAAAAEDALRNADIDENEQIYQSPLLAYLHPGRIAEIRHSTAFPFHTGFKRL